MKCIYYIYIYTHTHTHTYIYINEMYGKLQTIGEEKQKCTIYKFLTFKAVDIICR